MSTFRLHPILISIHEIYLLLRLDIVDDHLDASFWLKRPVKKYIKPLLTAFFLLAYMFQILFPDLVFVFLKFKSVFKNPVYEFIADPASIHQLGRPDVHVEDLFSQTKKYSSIFGSIIDVFLCHPGCSCRRQENQLLNSLLILFKVQSADISSKTVSDEDERRNSDFLPPLFDCLSIVVIGFLSSHAIFPITS